MYNDAYYSNGRRTFLNSVTVLDPAGAEVVALLKFDMQDLGHGPRACQASQKRAAARPVRVLYEPFRWGFGGAWKYYRLKTGSHLAPWQSPEERHAQSQRVGGASRLQVALPGTQVPGADIACFLPRALPALPLSGVYARASALSPAGNRLPVTIGHREDPRQQLCAVQRCCAALPPEVQWLLVRTLDSALRGASTLPAASNRNPSGVRRSGFFLDR